MTMFGRQLWYRLVLGVLGALLAIQIVPYGRGHTNPPVTGEPAWDAPQTRALAKRACFDCHSNETEWPGYATIAPVSWLVQHDVSEGRETLNFSEWGRTQKEAKDAAEEVMEGEMPPAGYKLVHAHARLTPAERDQLAQGLIRTLGVDPDAPAGERD